MTETTAQAAGPLSQVDTRFLAAAIELAEQGRFSTTPNPCVGCLLVRDGEVLGRGYHVRAGGPHAEVAAINDARAQGAATGLSKAQIAARLQGATAYVSLEPCAFHSRTPPCAEALKDIGVARVIGAFTDPHPKVAGRGYALLRDAGIEVATAELNAAGSVIEGYTSRIVRQRPFVRLKVAASLDGRTAMASGESQWITGSAARADVQYWRARSCAIITGRGTVVADDPAMNVRDSQFAVQGQLRQPLRVVLDSQARLHPDAQIFAPAEQALWVHAEGAKPASSVATLVCGKTQVDLPALLHALAERNCNEVLVEAGPMLIGQFLAQGLWDEALIYLAPKFLGSDARPLAQLPLSRMAQGIAGTITEVTSVGDDLRVRLRPRQTSTDSEPAA
ncbi:MAG: bifunctional diaminohydroxyphosphoribosylaminopyrimidine deaminase/5-amino-6-(5-phosphoribosylamino)uracil reductase RibD [Pseudomonadales bacterium]